MPMHSGVVELSTVERFTNRLTDTTGTIDGTSGGPFALQKDDEEADSPEDPDVESRRTPWI